MSFKGLKFLAIHKIWVGFRLIDCVFVGVFWGVRAKAAGGYQPCATR